MLTLGDGDGGSDTGERKKTGNDVSDPTVPDHASAEQPTCTHPIIFGGTPAYAAVTNLPKIGNPS